MHIRPIWRISASAALLGLGQNGLLVTLPVLVTQFGLPLSQWAGLILLGSMLFLIGSPFWGRMADRHGPRLVVVQALVGYMVSFGLIGLALWASAEGWLSQAALLGTVVLARVIYGLTVSGMVPACQQWSLALHGEEERLSALAAISAALSSGRLLGPLIAAACLSLSAYAPFITMLLAGLLALVLLKGTPQARTVMPPSQTEKKFRLPQDNLLYLLIAMLLTLSVAVMQLGLPMALQSVLSLNAQRAGYLMGILLSLGALGALATQLGVVRSRRLGGQTLLNLGALTLTAGYGMLVLADALTWFGLGLLVASIGAALAVPGYTDAATHHQAHGASAGLLGMAHTLGYGAATLALSLVAAEHLLFLSFASALILVLLLPLAHWRRRISRFVAQHSPEPDRGQ